MTSRVMRGFRRLGLVLSLPLFLIGLFGAVQEFRAPSGPVSWVKTLPKGAVAMQFDEPLDAPLQKMKLEQEENRIQLPVGFLLVGQDLGKVSVQDYTSNRFADLVLKTNEGRAFELRDGRIVVVGTSDESKTRKVAWQLLWNEAMNGEYFSGKAPMVFKDIPVMFRNSDKAKPPSKWPIGAREDAPREYNWSTTIGFLVASAFTFLIALAIGWVIDGFFSSPKQNR